MSRSVKKNKIWKDKGVSHKLYRRTHRRVHKCFLKCHLHEDISVLELPNIKVIINDANYCEQVVSEHHKDSWNNPEYFKNYNILFSK